MIDNDGYRPNVGIVICDNQGRVIWARRFGQNCWQFPQGGINAGESPEQAMYRELFEEVGLQRKDVRILAVTRHWLRYKLPRRLVRWETKPVCIGQKQKWFLLQLIGQDDRVNVNKNGTPEFDDWRWVSYWYPVRQVVSFKREVYRRVMKEFASVALTLHLQEKGELKGGLQDRPAQEKPVLQDRRGQEKRYSRHHMLSARRKKG